MSSSRRQFLKQSALAGSGLMLSSPLVKASKRGPGTEIGSKSELHPMNILILGGTSFVGPHLVHSALERGHSVSIFTRGRSVPTVHANLLNHVEKLVGDRENDLSALEGRQWDIVVDNSGRKASWTRDSARLLSGSAGLYVYTSSTGVYYPYLNPPISESRDLVMSIPSGLAKDEQAEYEYAVMKSSSELEARRAFGDDRTLIVRPTYIIGPGDSGDRFQHWPVRIEMGGRIMVPGNPDDAVQWIDVRDLAEFTIRMAEKSMAGTYNVVGPSSEMGIQACVHGIHAATSASVEWVSIPDYDFLLEHGVSYIVPWIMPRGNNLGSARILSAHAVEAGLTFRPLADTTRDILSWWHSDSITEKRRHSLTGAQNALISREQGIIDAWQARG
jgi:nucleoside-diphosphate-sugar epimerase